MFLKRKVRVEFAEQLGHSACLEGRQSLKTGTGAALGQPEGRDSQAGKWQAVLASEHHDVLPLMPLPDMYTWLDHPGLWPNKSIISKKVLKLKIRQQVNAAQAQCCHRGHPRSESGMQQL